MITDKEMVMMKAIGASHNISHGICPECGCSDTFTNANIDETHVWFGCNKCGFKMKIKGE